MHGWGIIEIKSKYILLYNKFFYLYNFLIFLNTYTSFLINFFFGFYKNYSLFLKIKGIGYKIISIGLNLLIKLGFSHRILYLFKKNVRFFLNNKQSILIKSRSLSEIKNILFIFQKIRQVNTYKKKGIFIKGSIIKIKVSKKKSKI